MCLVPASTAGAHAAARRGRPQSIAIQPCMQHRVVQRQGDRGKHARAPVVDRSHLVVGVEPAPLYRVARDQSGQVVGGRFGHPAEVVVSDQVMRERPVVVQALAERRSKHVVRLGVEHADDHRAPGGLRRSRPARTPAAVEVCPGAEPPRANHAAANVRQPRCSYRAGRAALCPDHLHGLAPRRLQASGMVRLERRNSTPSGGSVCTCTIGGHDHAAGVIRMPRSSTSRLRAGAHSSGPAAAPARPSLLAHRPRFVQHSNGWRQPRSTSLASKLP